MTYIIRLVQFPDGRQTIELEQHYRGGMEDHDTFAYFQSGECLQLGSTDPRTGPYCTWGPVEGRVILEEIRPHEVARRLSEERS